MERMKIHLGGSIDMLTGPLLKKILLFSLPLMASSVLQLLFNAADVVVLDEPFKGLDEAARYRDGEGNVYAGSTLLHAGLNMPEMQQDFDSVRIVLERV